MKMYVDFPGELEVRATVKGHKVITDQAENHGGQDRGPSPFDLFLASIATCTGFYALRFCHGRSIPTKDLTLSLETERNPQTRHLERINIELRVPEGFPSKYHKAILRAMDHCAVKKVIDDPPAIQSVVKVLD